MSRQMPSAKSNDKAATLNERVGANDVIGDARVSKMAAAGSGVAVSLLGQACKSTTLCGFITFEVHC